MIQVDNHEVRLYGAKPVICEDIKDLIHYSNDNIVLYMATICETELNNRHVLELQKQAKNILA